MSEFDCDGNWDVTQEAESLNKSLFGASKKKKSKLQASKTKGQRQLSNTLDDSDNETFTKKGMRKMKEKRRKQKQQGKKSGESGITDVTSSSPGEIQESRIDSNSPLSKSSVSPKKSSKAGKTGKVEKDLEKNPDAISPQKNKAKKRKKTSVSEEVKSSDAPNKKRRKLKSEDNALADGSVLSKEEPIHTQKGKRKRKKKNNSKKNKYAHLALNRKGKEAVEAKDDKLLTNQANVSSSSSSINGSKPKADGFSESLGLGSKRNKKGLMRQEKDANKGNNSVEISPKKAKLNKLKAGDSAIGNVKTFNTSQISPGTENKSVASNVVSKKNRKRKKDLLNHIGENSKAEPVAKKEALISTVSTEASTKLKEKSHKKVKVPDENAQVKNTSEKSNTVTSISSDNAKGHRTVKTNESVHPKKMRELQLKQKKLAQMLIKSGHGDDMLDSNSTNKTTKMQDKKKNKKKSKSSINQESLDTNSHVKTSKASSQNPREEPKKNPFLAKSGLTSKVSLQSHPTQDVGDSTRVSSSIWGDKATGLGSQVQEKLNAARFRYLNEQLYTCQGTEALQMFKDDRDAFKVYHSGFENQAAKWPVNPVNVIIKQIKDKAPGLVVADFGCGDAKLAQALPQKVYSFDLVALNPRVKACDMSNVPLQSESVDIAVFCLSLMGTNLDDYIHEANRVLKTNGLLKVVEVVSRFKGLSSFLASVSSHGFQLLNKRDLSQMFYLMDFKKVKSVKKAAVTKSLSLKPCVYKKR